MKDLSCRIVQYLPDMQFVVNDLDEPRVLPGDTDDIDARFNSSQCAKASKDFREHRHLHGTFNNRYYACKAPLHCIKAS